MRCPFCLPAGGVGGDEYMGMEGGMMEQCVGWSEGGITWKAILSEAVVTGDYVWRVRGIAWKAILSEAVVTRDTVPGLRQYGDCLKDSTLLCRN